MNQRDPFPDIWMVIGTRSSVYQQESSLPQTAANVKRIRPKMPNWLSGKDIDREEKTAN